MFALQRQLAPLRVIPYRSRGRSHLKWTIAGYYVDGKRVRRFFTSKEKANDFVDKLRIKKDNLGTRALGIDPSLHFMAIECQESLARYGKTIADATNFYRKHLDIVQRSCSLNELVPEFLQSKIQDGKRERYLRDLKTRLARFQREFGGRIVSTITTVECDDWLRGLTLSGQSRNNYRRVLSTIFAYAISRAFCAENPIAKTSKAKLVDKPVSVLSPAQVQELLNRATSDIVPALAIGAFAGLRPAEIERLDWKEVKLNRGFIEVVASKSKTASRRLVTIQPNLKKWLLPHVQTEGEVQPANFRKKFDAARAKAGLEVWPSNVLRHSYASYHLAKFQDAAVLALQMGHTTTGTLFAHYREVVTADEATAYFEVTPVKARRRRKCSPMQILDKVNQTR